METASPSRASLPAPPNRIVVAALGIVHHLAGITHHEVVTPARQQTVVAASGIARHHRSVTEQIVDVPKAKDLIVAALDVADKVPLVSPNSMSNAAVPMIVSSSSVGRVSPGGATTTKPFGSEDDAPGFISDNNCVPSAVPFVHQSSCPCMPSSAVNSACPL